MAETRYATGNLVTTHPMFIIKRTGDYTTALDGDTGRIVIQNADAFTVFNYCITNLPTDGLIQVKKGNYYINNTLPIVNGMTFLGAGISATFLILSNNADCDMFAYNTASHIYFPTWLHMSFDGNKSNNTAGSAIVTNAYVNDVLIFDCFIKSFSDEGIL